MIGYRIVEVKNNKVMSLFHGTNRSRVIPLDTWYRADMKIVSDGSHGKPYISGWHFLKTEDEAYSFFERMFRTKTNRRIIRCYVRDNIRIKSHSVKGTCYLAQEIFIRSEDIK